MNRRRVLLVLTGTSHEVRRELFSHGLKPPRVRYERSITEAVGKLGAKRPDGTAAEQPAGAGPAEGREGVALSHVQEHMEDRVGREARGEERRQDR
jgi:hypothetical protein